MRAPGHQPLKPRPMFEIIAVAEQDDPVRLAAVLIIDVPVGRELLKGDQEIVAMLGATAHHRSNQRQIERIDQRILGPFFEE